MIIISKTHFVNNSETRVKASISDICEYFQIPLSNHKNEIDPQYDRYMGPINPGRRIR